MNAATGVADEANRNLSGNRPLDFTHHLAQVDFRHHDGIGSGGDFLHLLLGEWPGSDEAELADLDAFVAGHLDATLRHTRGDAVGDHYAVGAVDLIFLEQDDLVGVLDDLVLQTADQLVLDGGCHVRVTAFIVRESGDVDVIALAGVRHVGHQIGAWLVGFALQGQIRAHIYGFPPLVPLMPMTSAAFVVFTLYMVPDPATTPLKPWRQAAFGFAVAAVYGVIQVLHLVFGLFFALIAVCAIRGISLYIYQFLKSPTVPTVKSAAVQT